MHVHKHERLSNFTLKTKELCFYFCSILYMFLFLFYIIHVFISVLFYTCFSIIFSFGAVVVVDSWIYNYLCNQCLSSLTLWVRTPLRRGVLDTTLCDKVRQLHAAGRWFSLATSVSSTNKTDHHDITEILLKVALNTINLNIKRAYLCLCIIHYCHRNVKHSTLCIDI